MVLFVHLILELIDHAQVLRPRCFCHFKKSAEDQPPGGSVSDCILTWLLRIHILTFSPLVATVASSWGFIWKLPSPSMTSENSRPGACAENLSSEAAPTAAGRP